MNEADLKVPSKVVAIPQVTAAPAKTGKAAGKQWIHAYVLVHNNIVPWKSAIHYIDDNKIRILDVANPATFKAKGKTVAPPVKPVTKSKTYQELSLDDLLALQGTLRFDCTIWNSFDVGSSNTNVHIVGVAAATTPKRNDNVETVTKTKTYQELSLEDLLALQGNIWYLDIHDLHIKIKTPNTLKQECIFNFIRSSIHTYAVDIRQNHNARNDNTQIK